MLDDRYGNAERWRRFAEILPAYTCGTMTEEPKDRT
jgi:hypothetical protein